MLGCDRSCDAYATCVPDGWTGGDGLGDACPADPADGPPRPDCGIWVSASLGQDSSPGTQEAPVQTLAQAIALAKAGPKRVYACGETYPEPVSLPSGISLFGGFDCENDWIYDGLSKRAKIAPSAGSIALTFLEGDKPSLVGDIEARSANAAKPGASSIAVLVQDEAKGALRRADIFAGNGADGAAGEDGDHSGFAAKKGLPGNDGTDACTAEVGLGGVAVDLSCGDGAFSASGPGGDGGELVASNGGDGLPLPAPNPADYGVGGKGEAAAPICTGGQAGVQGARGQDGVPLISGEHRTVTKEGVVVGGNGGDGKPGFPGQGGGGGGASFGKPMSCGAAPPGGAGGGSGGTGGCGGRGGKGGQAGGSSFGVVLRGQGVTLSDVHITAGNGGLGGKGGQSQPGGQGGLPGGGGQAAGAALSGCGGGIGGNGGNGGDGAGGRGGHTICIVTIGFDYAKIDGDGKAVHGEPGAGGYGGDPSKPGQIGVPGSSAGTEPFDP